MTSKKFHNRWYISYTCLPMVGGLTATECSEGVAQGGNEEVKVVEGVQTLYTCITSSFHYIRPVFIFVKTHHDTKIGIIYHLNIGDYHNGVCLFCRLYEI